MIIDSIDIKRSSGAISTRNTSESDHPPPYRELGECVFIEYPTVGPRVTGSGNLDDQGDRKLHYRGEGTDDALDQIIDGMQQISDSLVNLVGDLFIAAGDLLEGTGKILSGLGNLAKQTKISIRK